MNGFLEDLKKITYNFEKTSLKVGVWQRAQKMIGNKVKIGLSENSTFFCFAPFVPGVKSGHKTCQTCHKSVHPP